MSSDDLRSLAQQLREFAEKTGDASKLGLFKKMRARGDASKLYIAMVQATNQTSSLGGDVSFEDDEAQAAVDLAVANNLIILEE